MEGYTATRIDSQEEQLVYSCGNECLPSYLTLLTALVCLVCAFTFDTTKPLNSSNVIFIFFCVLSSFAIIAGLHEHKPIGAEVVLAIYVASFIIRLDYVLYTDVSLDAIVRQHDVGVFGANSVGHAGYIEWFFNHYLSFEYDPTIGQFYHPPLHHILVSLWMRFLTLFGFSFGRCVASIQYLTLFYSCCCSIVSEKIINQIGLNVIGKTCAFALISFHPSFIILAGSINNDILSLLFILLSVYATLLWWQDGTLRNIILIALSIGCGMMTKLTAAVLAPAILFVFIAALFRSAGDWKKLIIQLTAFCLVSFPLGLWYPLWKYLQFHVPLTFVQRLSVDSPQFVGNYSPIERMFVFNPHFFYTPFEGFISFGVDYQEYNPLVAILKNSMFGEYNFAAITPNIVFTARLLLLVNFLIIILSIWASFFGFLRALKSMDKVTYSFLLLYALLLLTYYFKFCIDFPHTCSMDYRYIVPTCVIGSIFIGYYLNMPKESYKGWIYRCISNVTPVLVGLFCILVSIVYVVIGLF